MQVDAGKQASAGNKETCQIHVQGVAKDDPQLSHTIHALSLDTTLMVLG